MANTSATLLDGTYVSLNETNMFLISVYMEVGWSEEVVEIIHIKFVVSVEGIDSKASFEI